MIVENRKIIANLNKPLFEYLDVCKSSIEIENTKNGSFTFSVIKGHKPLYFHSKYNPEKEAEDFIRKAGIKENAQHFFFIGTGLGYHIIKILNEFPKATYSIFEPNDEILKLFLENINLSKVKSNLIQVFTHIKDLKDLDVLTSTSTYTLVWPKTEQLYSEQIFAMYELMRKKLNHERDRVGTDAAFQERWTTNVMCNFEEILNTPNMLNCVDKSNFENKPVIIVAAGPSLNYEIELLRKIKEEKKAYIFSVGSAINSLLNYDIIPHGVFSYDPKSRNSLVLKKFKESEITNVPLVFGSTIGREALSGHNGPKVHFILSQDTISPYLMELGTDDIIKDASSIAIVTLQIVSRLNFSKIILVGQNLAFLEEKRFAEGISYAHINPEINEKEKQKNLFVDSVDGVQIQTSEMYYSMKVQLESIISVLKLNNVINTTKHGAKIAGTSYMSLQQVYETYLNESDIVNEEWYFEQNKYNKLKLISNFDNLLDSYKNIIKDLEKSMNIISGMEKLYSSYLFEKIAPLYNKFDEEFSKVINNDYFKILILPVIRVQHQNFTKNAHLVSNEKNAKRKYEEFKKYFIAYVTTIYLNLSNLDSFFSILTNYIHVYKEKELL